MRYAALLISLVVLLGACDQGSSRNKRRKRKSKSGTSRGADEVPQRKKDYADFDGKSFLGRSDAPKIDPDLTEEYMQKMERNNYDVVEHLRRDKGIHNYKVGGDIEIDIYPCHDSSQASSECGSAATNARAMKDMFLSQGQADHAEVKTGMVPGSSGFVFEVLRIDGNGLVKVGAHEGKYYVYVVCGGGARSEEKLGPIRTKAINAAKYLLQKLRSR
ncbi:MAG: hypothetical protein ACYTDY_10065 [Planctomycetota bacterium]|jgi:hypothetical protein